MSTPFHELKPSERAALASSNPKVYKAARAAWIADIGITIAKRSASPRATERRKLSSQLAELCKHGVPSNAA